MKEVIGVTAITALWTAVAGIWGAALIFLTICIITAVASCKLENYKRTKAESWRKNYPPYRYY